MTLQQVARLAGVQRPVVTMWISRSADTDHPFPQPIDSPTSDMSKSTPNRFDAAEIAEWLSATGRGNNPGAADEAPAHSSDLDELANTLDEASALLLLHHLLGEPLRDLVGAGLEDMLAAIEPATRRLLGHDEVLVRALSKDDLVERVDRVAEACFSAAAVLSRLNHRLPEAGRAWQEHALTAEGEGAISRIIAEVASLERRRWVPHGPGGLVMCTSALEHTEGGSHPSVAMLNEAQDMTPEEKAAWRSVVASGADLSDERADSDATPSLHIAQWQRVENPARFFDELDDLVLGLGAADAAIIVGPAALMLGDRPGPTLRRRREQILGTHSQESGPRLRYAARLPRGLGRFGGRRQLGIWVLGPAQDYLKTYWSVYGEHSATLLTPSMAQRIAADVAAAVLGGRALRDHAFVSSVRVATASYLDGRSLIAAAEGPEPPAPGDLMARVWRLDSGLLDLEKRIAAAPGDEVAVREHAVDWPTAVRTVAQDLAGVRLSSSLIGPASSGRVAVIGPDEVRHPHSVGVRTVDRLELERATTRSWLTQPGDVVFVASGGADAWVDANGGHVVLAPARALRARPDGWDGRVLDPHVAAIDVRQAQGTRRQHWRLRTVPQGQAKGLAEMQQRIQMKRAELVARQHELQELEQVLAVGFSTGALRMNEEH